MLKAIKSSVGLLSITAVSALIVLSTDEPAYAYTDPGTGGLLYQIVVISLALLGSYLGFLKSFLAGVFKAKPEAHENEKT